MKRQQSVTGALVIDKPEGPTSHDVVVRVRRALRTRAGHTGTLDPLATGVLALLLGRATRLMQLFQEDEKVYRARIRLGLATDTYDREGRVTQQAAPPELDDGECLEVLRRFQGQIEQQPPLYSAVKVKGERLYKAARRGERPARPARRVTITAFDLLDRDRHFWTCRIHCSSGTYVRTLADDIGKVLGCGAHLHELRRERSGGFDLSQAVAPSLPSEELLEAVIPIEELLPSLPRIDLPAAEANRIRHGNPVALKWTPPPAPAYRLFDQDRLIAVGRKRLAKIHPFVVLAAR